MKYFIFFIIYFLEIARIQRGGKPPGRDTRIVDIYHEKPIRLIVRVVVPVKEHPKFNFVGKLLGPKGNSMKRLQEDTMTKMAVLGKGSMRNKQQVKLVPVVKYNFVEMNVIKIKPMDYSSKTNMLFYYNTLGRRTSKF